MRVQKLEMPELRQFLIFEAGEMMILRKKKKNSTSHFQKKFPTTSFSPDTWLCAWLWLASYLKTLHCVLLYNGLAGLLISSKIKKVFCKELLTQIARSPSVKIHILWLDACQSQDLLHLWRLIWGNGNKLAAKLELLFPYRRALWVSVFFSTLLSDLKY